jgi:hypothetical protein
MAGIPVTVRKWLMDLGFVHKRATAAGRKYPAYI